MSLTLEQYIERLDTRTDLPWPTAPKIDPPKAKPHLERLPVKAVFWTVYGTLVAVPQGTLLFEPTHDFVMDAALDKVIKEFKMWNSMSRKPGAPSAYMKELYTKALSILKMTGSGSEKFPEVRSEAIWEDIVKKLLQKDYMIDAATYGSLNEFTRKIAYFYHASIQGAGPYPAAAETIHSVKSYHKVQGLLTDGQTITPGQLQRCLRQQEPEFDINQYFPVELRLISAEKKARKPSDTLLRAAVQLTSGKGIKPAEVLHVGSNLERDIGPAKKQGFRTALFVGDKNSLAATPDQLKDPALRPDVMLTELSQILEVVG